MADPAQAAAGPWADYAPQPAPASAAPTGGPAPVAGPWADYTAPQPAASPTRDALGGYLLPGPPAVGASQASQAPKTGLAANTAAGIAEGGGDTLNVLSNPFGNLVGKPLAAVATSAHDLLAPVFGYKPYTAEDKAFLLGDTVPQVGTTIVNKAADAIGAPRPDQVQPATGGQADVRALTRGAVDLMTLGASPTAGVAGTLGQVAKNAALGGISTAGSASAETLAPDALKPVASIVGGASAGALASLPTAGAGVGANALSGLRDSLGFGAKNALSDASGTTIQSSAGRPIEVTPAQADAAAAKITSTASNPQAVKDALNQQGVSTIPASPATTYQVTGDQNLGSLERGISQTDPAPFKTLANQQNAARVNALQGLTPETASPEAVSTLFRNQLDAVTQASQRATDAAQAGRDTALANIGGDTTGTDTASAQQQLGQQLRGQLTGPQAAAKENERALFEAVDPNGTLAVNAGPLRDQAQQILDNHGQYKVPMGDAENRIITQAAGLPTLTKFSDLKDLRESTTEAISKARVAGDAQTVRRLGDVLGGIHQAMEASVSDGVAQETPVANAGATTPEQAMMARLNALGSRQDVQSDAITANVGAGNGPSTSGPAAPPGEAPSVPGNGGAGGQANAGPSDAAGTSGVSGGPSLTPFDEAAQQRYADARAATRNYHATFTDPAGVGSVLAPGKWAGDYKLPDSEVLSTLTSGSDQAGRVQSYLKAGGDPSVLAGGLAFDLRRSAVTDGVVNPTRLAAWQRSKAEALSAFPELQQQVSTLAGAQDAVDSAQATQRQADTDYQQSEAGRYLNNPSPGAQIGNALKSDQAYARMGQLGRAVESSPDAQAGLQREVVNFIQSQMQGDKQAGDTGTTNLYGATLQKFLRQKQGALAQVMTPQQLRVMNAIADDIRSSDQSVGGNVLAGNSATAQNQAAAGQASVGGTLLSQIREHAAGTLLGPGVGAGVGGSLFGAPGAFLGSAIGTVGGKLTSSLRASNITTVDDLVKEAMLNPGLARVLLSRVTPDSAPNVANAFTTALARLSGKGSVVGAERTGRASVQRTQNALAG